jgi:hypothetical protein
MKENTVKRLVLSVLISIIVMFVVSVYYKHFSWVKSVDGKEFRGTIIQLSSEMSHGKYPRTHEYASILWDDGTSSYFEMPPVHNYSVGDTWVTKVDQGYLDMSRYQHGQIPQSKEEPLLNGNVFIFLQAIINAVLIVGFGGLVIGLFIWCFSKNESEEK